jgi:general secretion pathway protein M
VTLRERFEQLEPREQRLLAVMMAIFGAMLVLILPITLSAMAASRRAENDSLREAMASITKAGPALEQADADRQKVLARYARPAPPLAGFLEQLATAHQIEIPESQDQPLVKHGKKYEERATKIVLQKVGMRNLALFLEALANSGYPVRVSALDLRKRATEPDSWDVAVTVSAFDRKEPEKKAPAASDSAEAPEGQ